MAIQYDYSDVELSVVKYLNTSVMNKSFRKLATNDTMVVPLNNYVPNIWERSWIFDTQQKGYSKGDCVWKYVYTEEGFLDTYGDSVYGYCQKNTLLCAHVNRRWSEVKDTGQREKYLWEYRNVISGYADYSYDREGRLTVTKLYDSLFDYGPNPNFSKDIQIFVSLKDNNRAELSDNDSWRDAIIHSYDEYQDFVTNNITEMIENHVENYHLGGLSTEEQFSQKLLKKDFSNFDIDEVYSKIVVLDYEKALNSEGLDYVILEGKKRTPIFSGDKEYGIYQMFRLWNSGYLEHFGIIPAEKLEIETSDNPEDYAMTISLGWDYYDINGKIKVAPVYDYPMQQLSDSVYNSLYYCDSKIERMDKTKYMGETYRYCVNITPIYFDLSNDIEDGKIITYSELLENGYPESYRESKNKSLVTLEIHHTTNDSFRITKNNTVKLNSDKPIQFYSYHVTGYRLNENHKFIDLNSLSVSIKPLQFEYDGQNHMPTVEIFRYE